MLDAELATEPRVEAVEARCPEDLSTLPSAPLETYVELPLDHALEERLDDVAAHGLRAKVRCGGASVPDVVELGAFVRGCRQRRVVFKATAGLHHAVARDGEHGFLNLLAATVFGDEEAALSERDSDAFVLEPAAFRWRDRSASAPEVATARRDALHSIGSCSFFEPVEELVASGALPL